MHWILLQPPEAIFKVRVQGFCRRGYSTLILTLGTSARHGPEFMFLLKLRNVLRCNLSFDLIGHFFLLKNFNIMSFFLCIEGIQNTVEHSMGMI